MEGIDIDSIVRKAVTEYRRQERQEVASTVCAGEALALDIDTRRKLVYAKAKVELATLEVQDLEAELADEARAEARQVERRSRRRATSSWREAVAAAGTV